MATALAKKRNAARGKRRLAYDCMNAVVVDGGYVLCKRGHEFKTLKLQKIKAPRGATSLLMILGGRTPQICQQCPDYDLDDHFE